MLAITKKLFKLCLSQINVDELYIALVGIMALSCEEKPSQASQLHFKRNIGLHSNKCRIEYMGARYREAVIKAIDSMHVNMFSLKSY